MTSDLRMINLIFESAGIVLSLTGLIQAISFIRSTITMCTQEDIIFLL